MNTTITTITIALALALAAASIASAQTSPLYMQDGMAYEDFNTQVRIAQNGEVTGALQLQTEFEHNLVVAGDIRTYAGLNHILPGYRYDLDGNFLGDAYPPIDSGPYYGPDATTDGRQYNWVYDYGFAAVFRTTREWADPVEMFPVFSRGGIAYDPSSDTLWIVATDYGRVQNVTQTGEVLSEFTDEELINLYSAMALDPADGTLWILQGSGAGNGWRQYNRDGLLLASGHFFAQSKFTGAAEFDMTPPLCYPDFDGSGALDLFDFLEFVNTFNAADPGADCDASGALDLFDFLCFTNAFNAGC